MTREQLKSEIGLTDEQTQSVLNLYSVGLTKKNNELDKMQNEMRELSAYKLQKELEFEKISKEMNEKTGQIQTLEEYKSKFKELSEKIELERIEKDNAEKTKTLNNNILDYFEKSEKEFVNEFTKNSITQSILKELENPNNKGKGIGDIFEYIVQDKEDIFKKKNELLIMPTATTEYKEQNKNPKDMTYTERMQIYLKEQGE